MRCSSPSRRAGLGAQQLLGRWEALALLLVLCASSAGAELNFTALTKYPRFDGGTKSNLRPRINSTNPYLPDGCMTYDQRYYEYSNERWFLNRTEAWAPNTIMPHATKAVIMRIHSHTNFKPDLILAFRALMVEAQQYGYHVFFLTTAFSWDKHEKITRADLLQNIPPEFRQNVVLYDTADVRAHYPAHGISEFYSGYLPATWLMHKYQAYEFLYILESDIRLIGHWGKFLDAALAFSAHVPERFLFDHSKTDSGTGDTPMMTDKDRAWYKHTAVTLGNDNTQGRTADFIVFNGVSREWEHDVEQHGNTGHNQVFLNIGETYHAWIMVQGWSRKLMNQLHQWSRTGQGAYDEIAPTTIAVHEGDKVVSVKIPQFDKSEGPTFDRCCTQGGERFYEEMYKDRTQCKPYSLLHMVKISADMWNEPTVWQNTTAAQ